MSELFLQTDVAKLFHNKFVVVMGSSIQRSMYKDLVKMLKKDNYLTDKELRAKGEPKFEEDQLIEGGVLSNNVLYREVREYKTDYNLIRFYFITKCFNKYVDSVLTTFKAEPKPDVLLLNSCLWDITRYGLGPESVEGYRQGLHKLMKKLKTVLDPSCIVIWNSTLPVDKDAKGGVFVPEVESAKTQLGAKILACNLIAHNIINQYNYDYIDLHYYLRHHLHRRAEDGVHWDMTAHRRISNLTLFQIAEAWGLKKSMPVLSPEAITPTVISNGEAVGTTSRASASIAKNLTKAVSPSVLTKALTNVAKTAQVSTSVANTAQKSTPSCVLSKAVEAAAKNTTNTSKSKPSTVGATATCTIQSVPATAKSSFGPIKTRKKNKGKNRKKALKNQENVCQGKKANSKGAHYNRNLALKPQADINRASQSNGPAHHQGQPFNGGSNFHVQQEPPFHGTANHQGHPFNGPANHQGHPFNGPADHQEHLFNGDQQYHQGQQFHEADHYYEEENHYDEGHTQYNTHHIEYDLNRIDNVLYKNYEAEFANYDFTKDVNYNEGNYQSDGHYQNQVYEWHEYPQNDGGFSGYTDHAVARHRVKPYSRYHANREANRELYGGSRYQH